MKYVLLFLGFAALAFAQVIVPYSFMYTISFSDPDCKNVMGVNADIVHDPICDDAQGLYFGCHPYPGGYFGVYCDSPWIDPFSNNWPDNFIFYTKWPKENTSGICNYDPWETTAPFNYMAFPNTCAKGSSGNSFKLQSECGPDSPITILYYSSETNCTGNYRSKQTIYAINTCTLTTEQSDGLAYCQLLPPTAAPVTPPMDAPVAEPSASTPIPDTPAATPMSSPVADTPDGAPTSLSPVASPNAVPKSVPVATPVKKTSNAVTLTSSIGAELIALMCFGVLASLSSNSRE